MQNQLDNRQPEVEPTHYSATKRTKIPIRTMATPYLENAIRKLERELDEKAAELEALRKELRWREFERQL